MSASDSYRKLIAEVDGRATSLAHILQIYQERLRAAEASGVAQATHDARLGINQTNGALEVLREVKKVAREAGDERQLPFERMIGALESSYLTLEAAHDTHQRNQGAAFQRALVGGSRAAFEQATDDWNVATGRFSEISGLLHFARTNHEN